MPQLTSELFGSAWDERLAEAVDRLERADETIADSPEPERAVEELVADAATVQEAAPPEARERVNIWVRLFVLWLAERFLVDPALEAVREAGASLDHHPAGCGHITGPAAGAVDEPGARTGDHGSDPAG